jgi:hypothetical protein
MTGKQNSSADTRAQVELRGARVTGDPLDGYRAFVAAERAGALGEFPSPHGPPSAALEFEGGTLSLIVWSADSIVIRDHYHQEERTYPIINRVPLRIWSQFRLRDGKWTDDADKGYGARTHTNIDRPGLAAAPVPHATQEKARRLLAEAIAKWAAANQETLVAAERHARMTALGKAMESMRELEAKLAEAQAAVGEAFVRVREL